MGLLMDHFLKDYEWQRKFIISSNQKFPVPFLSFVNWTSKMYLLHGWKILQL